MWIQIAVLDSKSLGLSGDKGILGISLESTFHNPVTL